MPIIPHYLLQFASLRTLPVVAIIEYCSEFRVGSASDKVEVNHGKDISDPRPSSLLPGR